MIKIREVKHGWIATTETPRFEQPYDAACRMTNKHDHVFVSLSDLLIWIAKEYGYVLTIDSMNEI